MTYFHMRMHTIIGAKSFHCPVRDGKEWGQLAMVVRHNCRRSLELLREPATDINWKKQRIRFSIIASKYLLRLLNIIGSSLTGN